LKQKPKLLIRLEKKQQQQLHEKQLKTNNQKPTKLPLKMQKHNLCGKLKVAKIDKQTSKQNKFIQEEKTWKQRNIQ